MRSKGYSSEKLYWNLRSLKSYSLLVEIGNARPWKSIYKRL